MRLRLLLMLLLATAPLASADSFSMRYTGYTSGLFTFDGMNSYTYQDGSLAGGFYNNANEMRVYGGERRTGGVSYSLGWDRPLTRDTYYDGSDGRLVTEYGYGDWRMTDLRVTNPGDYHVAIGYDPALDTYGMTGHIGGRGAAPGYSPYMHPGYGSGARAAFNTEYNAYSWSDKVYTAPYYAQDWNIRNPGTSGTRAWY